jgi:hypothetical protein
MSTDNRAASDERISPGVRWWLLAVAISFLLGFIFLRLLPQDSSTTWSGGILVNLGLAVTIGIVLGWTRQGIQVLIAVLMGSVVTILGVDLLLLAPIPTENAHLGLLGCVIFDAVAFFVALIGMTILVGVAVLVGLASQLLARRSSCLARLQNLRELRGQGRHGEMSQMVLLRSPITSAG